MATHSSILAWKIPWMEEPGRLQLQRGRKESDMTERLHFTFHLINMAKPIQYCKVKNKIKLKKINEQGVINIPTL